MCPSVCLSIGSTQSYMARKVWAYVCVSSSLVHQGSKAEHHSYVHEYLSKHELLESDRRTQKKKKNMEDEKQKDKMVRLEWIRQPKQITLRWQETLPTQREHLCGRGQWLSLSVLWHTIFVFACGSQWCNWLGRFYEEWNAVTATLYAIQNTSLRSHHMHWWWWHRYTKQCFKQREGGRRIFPQAAYPPSPE